MSISYTKINFKSIKEILKRQQQVEEIKTEYLLNFCR